MPKKRAGAAAARADPAVTDYLGQWAFHACRDPQRLSQELAALSAIPSVTHA